jgi:predicted O-methyltransferase YrrM
MKKNLKGTIKELFYNTPYLKQNFLELGKLRLYKTWVPPGHFYSPIPSLTEIKSKEDEIFSKHLTKKVSGIDLNEQAQLELFEEFSEYYLSLPFTPNQQENLRYFYENISYSYSDAICLYCMINHAKPKKIIEVGSGYSSCLILDTNDLLFNSSITCTFIEPYPQLLLSLIKETDKNKIEIVPKKLQNVDIGKFSELNAGDILFIDSTHVSKVDSDVNHIFFEILPLLNKGVYIHFHDIFYPFEYPREWIFEGRAWNEAYMLRAFLQYNRNYEIVFFNTFLELFHQDKFIQRMPLCMKNTGGSIWLKKN